MTGFDELLVYRAKCCNPIRGEEIIGYITRGKGVAVHSKNCPNVQNLMYDAARKIEVEWAGASPVTEAYAVPLTIVTENRTGMLAEIAAAVADVGSNIVNAEARTADGEVSLISSWKYRTRNISKKSSHRFSESAASRT